MMVQTISIKIIDKATHAHAVVQGQEVSLSTASIVQLPLSHAQVKSLARQGNDLVITTVDGDTLVIHGFFTGGQNSLVMQGEDGGLWLADLSGIGALPLDTPIDPTKGGVFTLIDSEDPLLDPLPNNAGFQTVAYASQEAADVDAGATDLAAPDTAVAAEATDDASASAADSGAQSEGDHNSLGWLPLAYAGAGLATAIGGPALYNAISGGSSKPKAPTLGTIVQNDGGTLTVAGQATPGDTVTVTFPDKTTGSIVVNGDGSYSVTSDGTQTTGTVTVVDTSPSGEKSDPTSQIWTDTTPPSKPTVDIKDNGDGTITVTGQAEPGSEIKISYPDGTSATATARPDGSYEVTSEAPKTSGDVNVIAKDAAGNSSDQASVHYDDHTAPLPPQMGGVVTNPDGTITITGGAGSAEPGSTITVHWPDGTKSEVKVGSDGSYQVTSNTPQPDGTITITATDPAGNESPPTDYSYNQADHQGQHGVVITAVARDTGDSPSDAITDDNTLIIVGTVKAAIPAGDALKISLDGGKTWNAVKTDGTDWTYDNTDVVLDDGTYQVVIQEQDAAGKAVASYVKTVVVDTVAPTETTTITLVKSAAISGTLSAALNTEGGSNEYVVVSTDGGKTWHAATVDSTGTHWTYMPAAPLHNGTYTVQARVVDVAGNVGQTTAPTQATVTDGPTPPNITIDAIAPDNGAVGNDFITSSSHLVFLGTLDKALESGQSVQISLDGGKTWSDKGHPVSVDGVNWSYDYSASTLADGNHIVQARVIDASTKLVGAVATQPVVVDTTPPAESITIGGIISNTGAAGGWTTSDNTLVFYGKLGQPLNTAGGSGEYVQISLDGGITWHTADVSGTTWIYDNTAHVLPNGNYLIVARVVDVAGNVGQTAAHAVTVSGSIPPAITIEGVVPDNGPFSDDFITDSSHLMFLGTLGKELTAGQVAQISLDGGKSWEQVAVNGTGWRYDNMAKALADGSYTVQARVIDSAQNLVGAVAVQPLLVDTTPPAEGITIAGIISDSGVLGDWITADNTLVFYGRLSQPLDTSGGSAEYVQVSLDGGITWNAAQVNGTTWSYDNTGTALKDGNYTVQARVVDTAGNVGQTATHEVTIKDGVPPAITIDSVAPDNGLSPSDFVTNVNKLVLSGTVGQALGTSSGGTAVQVSLDGGQTWNQASVNGLTWTFDDTAKTLPDGTYQIVAKVVDASGAQVGTNARQTLVVDTVAPTEGIAITAVTTDTNGVDATGAYNTADQTLVFSGTLTQPLNNSGGSREYVQVSLDGQHWHAAQVSGTTWNFDNTGTVLANGTYTVQVQVVDAAGNVGHTDTAQVIISNGTELPAANITIDRISPDTGSSPNDYITDSQQVTLSGTFGRTLLAGESVQVSLDGGKTWINAAWDNAALTWSYAASLPDATYPVQARVNSTTTLSDYVAQQTVVVDSHAPTEVVTIAGGTTAAYDSSTPTFTGTLSAVLADGTQSGVSAEQVYITIVPVGVAANSVAPIVLPASAITTSGGVITWSYTPSAALADGQYTVTVQIRDVAGNADPLVATQTATVSGGPARLVTVDSVTPDTGASGTDFVTNSAQVTINGKIGQALSAGQTLQVSVNNGGTWVDVPASNINGFNWTFSPGGGTGLADANYTVLARITDTSGQTIANGITQDPQTLVIDTKPPTELITITSPDAFNNTSLPTFTGKISSALANGTQSGVSSEQLQLIITPQGGTAQAPILLPASAITVDGSGNVTWSYTPTIPMANGTYTVAVEVVDQAGNTSTPVTQTVAVSGLSETNPILISTITPDTGLSGQTIVTNPYMGTGSGALTVSGMLFGALGAGQSVQVSTDGGQTWLSAPATVEGLNWTCTLPHVLPDGSYTIAARISGGTSASYVATQALVVDTKPPTEAAAITSMTPDTGNNTGDFITNANQVSISGTLSQPLGSSGGSTETLQISLDAGKTWVTVPSANVNTGSSGTTWTYAVPSALADNTYTVQVRVVDDAGNTGLVGTQLITISTHQPSEVVTITGVSDPTSPTTPWVTTDSTPTISGKLSTALNATTGNGQTEQHLQISLDGGKSWTMVPDSGITTSDSSTTWTYTPTTALQPGAVSVQVQVIDVAGNTGTPASQQIVVGSANENLATITTVAINGGDPTPHFAAINTNQVTLGGTLTSELTANQIVQVSVDGGATWQNVAATAVTGTTWTYAAALNQINGVNTVESRVLDTQTNIGSTASIATIQVDTTAPTEGIAITGITPNAGVPNTWNSYTGNVTINGTLTTSLDPGGNTSTAESVQISTDGGRTWNTATVAGSTWSYTPEGGLSNGSYTLQVRVVDAAGNAGQMVGIPGGAPIVISSVTPSDVAAITSITPDTGATNVDGSFFTTTKSTNGQIILNGSVLNSGAVSAAGQGEAVQVSTDGGAHWNTATLSADGKSWSYTTALSDGSYTLQARVISATGTYSAPDSKVLVIDNVAPLETATLTTVTDGATGADGGFVTPSLKPTLSGTLNSVLNSADGSTEGLLISLDDGQTWAAATVSGTTWSFDTGALNSGAGLASGSYKVVLQVADQAGNVGAPSKYTVDVNTTPTETVTVSAIGPDTGTTGDWITSTATAAGGNGKLTVTGTLSSALQANEGVQVSLDGGKTWTAATVTGTNWTVDLNNVADGTHTITARAVNTVTQQGGPADTSKTVLVDNTATTDTVTILLIDHANGAQGTGFTTSATGGITFYGAISSALSAGDATHAAEKLQISTDGGQTWADVTNFPSSTSWSYKMPSGVALASGENVVVMQVVDAAGNVQANAAQQTVTVATPPTFSNLTLQLAPGSDDGDSATDNITSIATPTITGSVVTSDPSALAAKTAGTLVATIYIDRNGDGIPGAGDQILGTAPVGANGTFTVNLASMAPGTYTLSAAIGHDGVYSNSQGNVTLANSVGNKLTIAVDTASETYTQPTQSLGLGYSMSAIGDFNGDGYADYIVSAPRDLQGGVAGRTTLSVEYLIYGGPNGLPNVGNLDSLTPAQGFKLTNTNTTDYGIQGLTVTDVGDMNGDGLSDVAISSNANDTTYVLFGQRGNTQGTFNLNSLTNKTSSTAGFAIKSNGGGSYLGCAVTGGDINGDGYSDLILGVPNSGSTFVIYGHEGAWADYNVTGTRYNNSKLVYTTATGGNGADAKGYTKITNGDSSSWLGGSMGAVGDVNGDGYTDFVVTAPETNGGGGSNSGVAYLIFGYPGIPTSAMLAEADLRGLTPSQGITLTSSQAGEFLGGDTLRGSTGGQAGAWYVQYHSITSLGDINGDGYTDFAIGSPGAVSRTGNNDGAGAVYVVYGTAAGTNWSNLTLPAYNSGSYSDSLKGKGFVLHSSTFTELKNGVSSASMASDLGFSVSNVGDVNGDGVDDFMVGAPMANNGEGAAFLVFGKVGGLPGASSGVIDLDDLVAAGNAAAFGTPGTAIQYNGESGGGTSTSSRNHYTNTYMGTDVTGGDFDGSGISSYSFSSWNDGNSDTASAANNGQGMVFVHNGTTAYLTQAYTVDNDILYAGDSTVGAAAITGGVNRITGGQGNDVIHGIGAAADVAYGGAGNDAIGIVGTQFQRVNGGSGWDTLVFEGNDINLNLAALGAKVQSFEVFDLNNQTHSAATDPQGKFTANTTGNTLAIRLADVLNLTQEVNNANATASTEQRVTILGDSTSTVVLDGTASLAASNWMAIGSQTVNGVVYGVYHNNLMGTNTATDLLIQQGVNVI